MFFAFFYPCCYNLCMGKIYAGIGSRKTPAPVLEDMKGVAFCLGALGWTLRSGGAEGADKAFEEGCNEIGGSKEIFYAKDANAQAIEIAKKVHPMWYKLGAYAQKLHARNCFQILGGDLVTPCRFILCWTPDGANGTSVPTSRDTGGTGQAIRIAKMYFVPVINMYYTNWRDQLEAVLR